LQAHFVRYMQQQAVSARVEAGGTGAGKTKLQQQHQPQCLPLGSGGSFPPAAVDDAGFEPCVGFERWAGAHGFNLALPVARSGFATLTGCGDVFYGSVEKMKLHAREGVFASEACIPGRDAPTNIWRSVEIVYQDGEFASAVLKDDHDVELRCETFSSGLRKVEAGMRACFASAGAGRITPQAWRVVRAFSSLKQRFEAQLRRAKMPKWQTDGVWEFVQHEAGEVKSVGRKQWTARKDGSVVADIGQWGIITPTSAHGSSGPSCKFRQEDVYKGLELLTGSSESKSGIPMLPRFSGCTVQYELWKMTGTSNEGQYWETTSARVIEVRGASREWHRAQHRANSARHATAGSAHSNARVSSRPHSSRPQVAGPAPVRRTDPLGGAPARQEPAGGVYSNTQGPPRQPLQHRTGGGGAAGSWRDRHPASAAGGGSFSGSGSDRGSGTGGYYGRPLGGGGGDYSSGRWG
jgi:hypothetical protein